MDESAERRVSALLSHVVSPRVQCVLSAHAVEEFTDQRVGELCAGTCSATERPGGEFVPENVRLLNIDGVGVNGNLWHPVAVSSTLRAQEVREVVFWGSSICLWRGKDGPVSAIEDRCAHRQLRLSKGTVDVNNVTCCYHGWEYDGKGKVVKLAHEIPKSFKTLPDIRVRAYPTQERYGLVWLFTGDPALAAATPIPAVPWLDSKQAGYVTRFADMTVSVPWQEVVQRSMRLLRNRSGLKFTESPGDLCLTAGEQAIHFRYPALEVQQSREFTEYIFPVPIDAHQTRLFALMVWAPKDVLGVTLPAAVRSPLHTFTYRAALHDFVTFCKSLSDSSQREAPVNEAEQAFVRAATETGPVQWNAYLESEHKRQSSVRKSEWRLTHGAGLGYQRWADFQ